MSGFTSQIKSQQGVALFVSLVFLLILTILGISSMQSTVMEEKMAGNFNDHNRAFQAGESSLRVAENWLQARIVKPAATAAPNSGQVWSLMDAATDPDGVAVNCSGNNTMWWRQCNAAWWTANAVQDASTLSNISTNPYYVIEDQAFARDNLNVGQQGDNSGRSLYRVTAKGTGGNDLTRVLLQSSYSKRF